MAAVDRDLDRCALGGARLLEVAERDRQLRGAGERAPARLGLAVEALALEAAEQQRPLRRRGPSTRPPWRGRSARAFASVPDRERGPGAACASRRRSRERREQPASRGSRARRPRRARGRSRVLERPPTRAPPGRRGSAGARSGAARRAGNRGAAPRCAACRAGRRCARRAARWSVVHPQSSTERVNIAIHCV